MKNPTETNETGSHAFTTERSTTLTVRDPGSSRPEISRRLFHGVGPRSLATIAAAAMLALSSGCSSVTLFQSSFNSNPVGAAPAHAQSTGTIDVAGDQGSVAVVNAPITSTEHWTKITHTDPNAPISTMLCNFSAVKGVGTYSLIAAMFIPSGRGAATVEFDTSPAGSPPNTGFLHLDFLPDGTVRMDDDPNQIWGTYSHDQPFDLSMSLDITATTAVAHMTIIGSGTSGSKDYAVPLGKFANQLGAVKIWMGSPWVGSFDVTDIIITKRNN